MIADYEKLIKKVIFSILGAIFIFIVICFGITAKDPFIIPIHTNDIHFTDKYDSSATLLIPAAYTSENGTIEGEYRIAGKTYGTPTRKERISLHPTKGIIISGNGIRIMDFSRQCLLKTVKSVTMMTHTKLLDVHLQQ